MGYRVCECLCVCVHAYVCVCGGVDFIACVLWTCTVGNAGEDSGVVLGSSPPPTMYLGGHKLPPAEPSTHHFQKATLWLPRSLLPQTTVRLQPLPLKTPRLCPPPSCLDLSADFSLISHHHSDATPQTLVLTSPLGCSCFLLLCSSSHSHN